MLIMRLRLTCQLLNHSTLQPQWINAVILLVVTQHSGVNAGKKKIWKNLKQIMGLERGLPWKQDDPTCKDRFSGLSDQ